MHIIFCMYLLLVRFLEHKYSKLFYVNQYVLSCYITFIFIVETSEWSNVNRHSIHMIFTYLTMHFGVPHINHLDKNFKLSDAPVSKHLERPQQVYI